MDATQAQENAPAVASTARVVFAPGVLHKIVESIGARDIHRRDDDGGVKLDAGLLDDIVIKLRGREGIEVCMVEPAHVALVHLKVAEPHARVVEGEGAEVMLDLEKIAQDLAGIPRDAEVHALWTDVDGATVVRLDARMASMSWRVGDPRATQRPKVPDISGTITTSVELDARSLGTPEEPGWIRRAGLMSDHVLLEVEAGALEVTAGDTALSGLFEARLPAGTGRGIGRYSLDYLAALARFASTWGHRGRWRLDLGDHGVMRVFSVDEGIVAMGLLAPRPNPGEGPEAEGVDP